MVFVKKKRFFIGSIGAVLLVFFLLRQIDLTKLHNIKIDFNSYPLTIAFLLYILINIIRAKRFNLVLDNEIKLRNMFKVTALYNLYTGLFPGGIGELSFIYLIKGRTKNHIPSGVSAVMITRIFDILTISVFAVFSLIMLRTTQLNSAKYIYILIGIIFALFLLLRYLPVFIKKTVDFFDNLLNKNRLWNMKIREKCISLQYTLETNKSKNLPLFLLSVLLWAVSFSVIQLFFWSIGLELSYLEAVFMGAVFILTTFIPLNTFGGFGYKEAGLTLGLILLGVIKNEAIIYSFYIHLVSLSFIALLAFVGFMVNFVSKNTDL